MSEMTKLEEMIEEFGKNYSSEPNKRIDDLLGEIRIRIIEDFEEKFENYVDEKQIEVGDVTDLRDKVEEWVDGSITIDLP